MATRGRGASSDSRGGRAPVNGRNAMPERRRNGPTVIPAKKPSPATAARSATIATKKSAPAPPSFSTTTTTTTKKKTKPTTTIAAPKKEPSVKEEKLPPKKLVKQDEMDEEEEEIYEDDFEDYSDDFDEESDEDDDESGIAISCNSPLQKTSSDRRDSSPSTVTAAAETKKPSAPVLLEQASESSPLANRLLLASRAGGRPSSSTVLSAQQHGTPAVTPPPPDRVESAGRRVLLSASGTSSSAVHLQLPPEVGERFARVRQQLITLESVPAVWAESQAVPDFDVFAAYGRDDRRQAATQTGDRNDAQMQTEEQDGSAAWTQTAPEDGVACGHESTENETSFARELLLLEQRQHRLIEPVRLAKFVRLAGDLVLALLRAKRSSQNQSEHFQDSPDWSRSQVSASTGFRTFRIATSVSRSARCTCACVHPTGASVLVGTRLPDFRLSGSFVFEFSITSPSTVPIRVLACAGDLNSLRISDDSTLIVGGCEDGSCVVWTSSSVSIPTADDQVAQWNTSDGDDKLLTWPDSKSPLFIRNPAFDTSCLSILKTDSPTPVVGIEFLVGSESFAALDERGRLSIWSLIRTTTSSEGKPDEEDQLRVVLSSVFQSLSSGATLSSSGVRSRATGLSVVGDNPSNFVISTDAGCLATLSQQALSSSLLVPRLTRLQSDLPLSPVTCLAVSPFESDLVLCGDSTGRAVVASCTSSKRLVLQSPSLDRPITHCAWSPVASTVVYLLQSRRSLLVWSLVASLDAPALVCDLSVDLGGARISTLHFWSPSGPSALTYMLLASSTSGECQVHVLEDVRRLVPESLSLSAPLKELLRS